MVTSAMISFVSGKQYICLFTVLWLNTCYEQVKVRFLDWWVGTQGRCRYSAVSLITRFDFMAPVTRVITALQCISQERGCIETETLSDPDFVKFQSYFDVNPELSDLEKSNLFQCLYEHKEVFITDENPGLGLTHVVKHHIQLKPDFQPKHQRPYRLPPDKKQVLKHQLDELLAQGIIAETEELPITSPIVLVAKRNKPKVDPNNITREQSLSSYRFCCDFRYLNTQTLNFRYTIPD